MHCISRVHSTVDYDLRTFMLPVITNDDNQMKTATIQYKRYYFGYPKDVLTSISVWLMYAIQNIVEL